jgi:hypothetical protein
VFQYRSSLNCLIRFEKFVSAIIVGTIPLRKFIVVMETSCNCLCANKVASPDTNHGSDECHRLFLANDKLFYLPEVDASPLKLQTRAGYSRGTPYPASFIPMRSLNHTKLISPIPRYHANSRIIPFAGIQSPLPNLTFPPTFKCTCVTVTQVMLLF